MIDMHMHLISFFSLIRYSHFLENGIHKMVFHLSLHLVVPANIAHIIVPGKGYHVEED